MTEMHDSRERELARIFEAMNVPLAAGELVLPVMRRVRRYERIRRSALASAAALGLSISGPSCIRFAQEIVERLPAARPQWSALMPPMELGVAAGLVVCAILLPAAIRGVSG